MNKEMKEKLRTACSDAADVFDLMPATFAMGAYAIKDGVMLPYYSRGYVVKEGDCFCGLGAVSYLSGYTLHSAAEFLIPSLRELVPDRPMLQPESYNNDKGREAVIRLLRHAAIRTEPTSEAAAS